MKHTFKELSVETAAVPAGGELWGAIVARKHPAGGAGTSPKGMRITWKDEEGEANAQRIVQCVNSFDNLIETLTNVKAYLNNSPNLGDRKLAEKLGKVLKSNA